MSSPLKPIWCPNLPHSAPTCLATMGRTPRVVGCEISCGPICSFASFCGFSFCDLWLSSHSLGLRPDPGQAAGGAILHSRAVPRSQQGRIKVLALKNTVPNTTRHLLTSSRLAPVACWGNARRADTPLRQRMLSANQVCNCAGVFIEEVTVQAH